MRYYFVIFFLIFSLIIIKFLILKKESYDYARREYRTSWIVLSAHFPAKAMALDVAQSEVAHDFSTPNRPASNEEGPKVVEPAWLTRAFFRRCRPFRSPVPLPVLLLPLAATGAAAWSRRVRSSAASRPTLMVTACCKIILQ